MIDRSRRNERGQGTLEYIAAIAIAAVIMIAVAGAVLAQDSGVRSAAGSALCKMFTLGTGECGQSPTPDQEEPGPDSWLCQTLGWGCSTDQGGDEDKPWLCDWFGFGCGDDQSDDPPVDVPDGLDEKSALVQTLLSTERGRQTLQWLADNDIPIRIDPDQRGAYWDGNEIVLGGGNDDAPTLVHEANHAKYSKEGRSADPKELSRDDYVRGAIAEEADGVVQQVKAAKEFRAAGQDVAEQPGEDAYTSAYEQAIKDGKSTTEAESAGLRAVTDEFYNGGFITSTNGQSYPDYYGSYWDSVN